MKFENDFEQKFARMDLDFQMLKMKAVKSGFLITNYESGKPNEVVRRSQLRIGELYLKRAWIFLSPANLADLRRLDFN